MAGKRWSQDELLIAMNLYCKIPFSQFHQKNPKIITLAESIGRTPSSLSMKLCNLASFDPVHQARGVSGLKGASKADREVWDYAHEHWDEFIEASELLVESVSNESIKNFEDENQRQTTVETVVKSRRGQQFFRQVVLSAYEKCCITSIPVEELLIASHIVPWSRYPSHRLNPSNGLCLNRLHDAAFDRGLMTISNQFTVVYSDTLLRQIDNSPALMIFEPYSGVEISLPERFPPDQNLLAIHRREIFTP